MEEIYEIFEEFETNVLPIKDFGIVMNECLVTHLYLNDKGVIEVWAGNPVEDEYAEQLILTKSQLETLFDEVCDLY